jgi:hypothetical protein
LIRDTAYRNHLGYAVTKAEYDADRKAVLKANAADAARRAHVTRDTLPAPPAPPSDTVSPAMQALYDQGEAQGIAQERARQLADFRHDFQSANSEEARILAKAGLPANFLDGIEASAPTSSRFVAQEDDDAGYEEHVLDILGKDKNWLDSGTENPPRRKPDKPVRDAEGSASYGEVEASTLRAAGLPADFLKGL